VILLVRSMPKIVRDGTIHLIARFAAHHSRNLAFLFRSGADSDQNPQPVVGKRQQTALSNSTNPG